MLQYDKSAGVVHVDWFHPWKPNRFSSLWIWLSLTSQRFHMRMYWSHFIHHSKAIHWVINPLAYLAAGDSTAEQCGWLGHKHWAHTQKCTHTHTHTFTFHVNTDTHIFCKDTHARFFEGVAMVTHEWKNLVIRLEPKTRSLTQAASRDRKIFLLASRKRRARRRRRRSRKGGKKQNSITQSKPTPCPPGVISAPFKSLITHKTNNILTPW